VVYAREAGGVAKVKAERKTFFFEKETQKSFCPGGLCDGVAIAPKTKVFFASFLFTKRKFFLSEATS
jgi:hypothetical protein